MPAQPIRRCNPLALFRVYVGRHFYEVGIFQTRREMRREADIVASQVGLRQDNARTEAVTTSWREFDGHRRLRRTGAILFYIGNVGSGIVSHEMTHAMFHWARYNRRATEEKRAWVQGDLVRQFWKHFYRLKLDKLCAKLDKLSAKDRNHARRGE